MQTKKKRKTGSGSNQETKYDETVPVRAYELIRQGMSVASTASAFKVSAATFFAWMGKYPVLKDAVRRAQRFKKGEGADTFRQYVYGRLSPEARRIWKKIHRLEHARKENRIKALLEKKGKYIRQQLFFHSLICSNFNISSALRRVCLSHSQYQSWIQRDAEFAKLVKEFDWHKKNFFESSLIQLVKDKDSAATIMANRTLNRDRGYNDKIEMDIKIEDRRTPVQVALDTLPVEVREQFLEAMRHANKTRSLSSQDVPIKQLVDMSGDDTEAA